MEIKNRKHYRDQWGGTNYGCYPLSTEGEKFKKRLDASDKWGLISLDNHIDNRNDNQCDIHRGSDFIYEHIESKERVFVKLTKSRSGKTRDWTFSFTFLDAIEF